jgi:Lon protease-like protein
MIKQTELPDTIAIFPMEGVLLLPRSRLPLHIFEPRYLQMIEDAIKTDARIIGVIQPNAVPGRQGHGLHTIGCAGRITQFSETEDGRYMVTLGGASRFRILREVEGFSPYRKCDVNWEGFDRDLGKDEVDTTFKRAPFLDLLGRYFDAQGLSADWDTLKDADDELLINSLSMMLDLAGEDKQALLEAPSLQTRRETLATLIEFSMRGGSEEIMMQ